MWRSERTSRRRGSNVMVLVYLNEEKKALRYMVTRSVTARRKVYARVYRESGGSELGREQIYDALELRFVRIWFDAKKRGGGRRT